MGKLFNLKKWLTLPDTARHLSIVLGEEVTEADILRLALDGHLKLSIHLVNGAYARPCVPVKIEDIEWHEMPSIDGNGTIKLAKNGRCWQDERGTFQVLEVVSELSSDVWDLPLIGGERIDIEHLYQQLTSGLEVTAVSLDGVFVEGTSGNLHELQAHCSDNPNCNKEQLKQPFLHFDNFHPAGRLPKDAVLVVRTEALRDFEQKLSSTSHNRNTTLSDTEKTSLLKIIAALAANGYRYPERGATADMLKDFETSGCGVVENTLKKYLEAASQYLPAKPDKL